jgi:hypothetical protein
MVTMDGRSLLGCAAVPHKWPPVGFCPDFGHGACTVDATAQPDVTKPWMFINLRSGCADDDLFGKQIGAKSQLITLSDQ